MEILSPRSHQLSFRGNGGTYFGILIVNWLLTVITLGIYYPWAKARNLQYLYGATYLNEDNFIFHGTGKEMFKGFIKAIFLFLGLFLVFFFLTFLGMPVAGIIILYAGLIAIMPLAIHGSYRYRMSRTSWRSIRFGYRGDRKELIVIFLKGFFLTLFTLGIYSSWFIINLRNYLLSQVRFGSLQFKYKGDGFDYFIINLKGFLLTIITLGIYAFWWQKQLFEYFVNNLSLHKDDKNISFRSTASGGGIFVLSITNILLLIFTLGFGYAWIVMRSLRYVFSNIKLEGDADLDSILQTEENYKDATGEDVSDFLDMDLVI